MDYIIPGCPPQPDRIKDVVDAVMDILKNGKPLPPKGTVLGADAAGLLRGVPAQARREEDRGSSCGPHEIVQDPEICLLEQGMVCMGPATRAGCGAKCVQAGVPCRGCYGPPANVRDQGAKMASAIAGVIDSDDPEEIEAAHRLHPRPDRDLLPLQPPQLDAPQEAAMSPRSIMIDPITRLEGHGKIHLFVDDDGEPRRLLLPGAGAARLRGLLPGTGRSRRCRGSRPGSAASAPRPTTWPR